MWTLDDVFGDSGFLAQKLVGYEPRASQVELSEAIGKSLNKNHLVAEGPTGSGKGFAYLVPAIRQILENRKDPEFPQSANRLVVATANIALQEQLFNKDLPALREILPDEFHFALVKGRNNYLCKSKLELFTIDKVQEHKKLKFGEMPGDVNLTEIIPYLHGNEREVCEWAQRTETGDKSELMVEPSVRLWGDLSVTANDCQGSSCPMREECFANQAKLALQAMDVIVVNYHLLFAAVKVRGETGVDIVLPSFSYLVCDEAHRMADIARAFFGWDCSEYSIKKVLSRYEKVIKDTRGETIVIDRYKPGDVWLPFEAFKNNIEDVCGNEKGSVRIKVAEEISGYSMATMMKDIAQSFYDIGESRMRSAGLDIDQDSSDSGFNGDLFAEAAMEKSKKKSPDAKLGVMCKQYSKLAEGIGLQLLEATKIEGENSVYFVERFGKARTVRVCKRMLDVSSVLWDDLFDKTATTVLTSATMSISNDCSFIRKEVGLKEAQETIVDSPFNHLKQACIVLSARAPDPTQASYAEKVSVIFEEIIRQAEGRTMGLFTSYFNLNKVATAIRESDLDYNILVQGEAPRSQLVKRFKEDVSSVLLGTESFWTGVDVPGEALSCLMIDKIPFPSFGDPVLSALSDREGRNGFWNVSVPRAVLQFRQGVGRLIRRSTDRGIVIVLDCRLVTKGYGNYFTDSLPRMTRAKGIRNGQIRRWLSGDV